MRTFPDSLTPNRTPLMKNSRPHSILFALLLLPCCWAISNAQTLPTDPQPSCVVPSATFASWFEAGAPSLNGVVNPANSVTFSHANNCAFYQWSAQMFLWLTSPAPPSYGGGAHIFDSPTFFDVSPPEANGNRNFIPHVPGNIRPFKVRAAKVGPNRLPVIMDKRGRMFEIEKPKLATGGKQLILNRAGKTIEIGQVTVEKGKAVFHDKAGKVIANPKAIVRPELKKALIVQKFMSGGKPIFVDATGTVIETEEGQADGSVLLAQNGSLIYYVAMVNDVYAYFLTGTATGGINPKPTQFPTSQADLDKITAFAKNYGVTFPDPNALAIELKTAWVDATGLPNPSSYITMQATIPTYNTSDPTHWTEVPNGQKQVQLALVGMHVVGSAAGHAEMIWSSFEHFGNSPNAAYQYVASDGTTKTVAQSTTGSWLFTASNSSGPFNNANAQICGSGGPNDICVVAPASSISASNTLRTAPFGAAPNVSPNAEDASAAASNSEVIGINNSVVGQLQQQGADVRANYYLIGSTWTNGGVAPTAPFNSAPNSGGGNEVGTSQLANTTMETYEQIQTQNPAWSAGVNCFACHQQTIPPTSPTTALSHIFGNLQPLPPPFDKTKTAPKKP